MKVLFITKHNPFDVGGSSIASLSFIQLFSELSNSNLDLVMAAECFEKQKCEMVIKQEFLVHPRSVVRLLLEYPRGIFHRYNTFIKKSKILSKSYDYVILDNSSISSTFIRKLNKKKVKTITIHHNYEPEYFLADNKTVLKYLLLPLVIRNEKCAYKLSWMNIFLTEDDKSKFVCKYGKTHAKNISCFFMIKQYVENTEGKKYEGIITCSLENYQNIRCITKFVKDYKDSISILDSLVIAGRNPNRELIEMLVNYSNIFLFPNPQNMSKLLNQVKFYICPIEDGGGIKIRCFDAISNYMPVIIHKNSIRGYEVLRDQGLFFEYHDNNSFKFAIQKVNELLSDKYYKKKYKYIIEEYYSIKSAIKKLKIEGVY